MASDSGSDRYYCNDCETYRTAESPSRKKKDSEHRKDKEESYGLRQFCYEMGGKLPRLTHRHRRNRSSSQDEKGGESNGKRSAPQLLVYAQDKYKRMRTRVLSSLWMIGGFIFVLYMGHMYIWLMIVIIQLFMAHELFSLARAARREKQLPGFRVINWWFFVTAMTFVYGRFLKKQLTESISADKLLARLFVNFIRYHMIISYFMYIIGFVLFILSLKKRMYQYQFGQFAWTHMILFLVFAQSSFTVANIFEGIIWFLLPCTLIIVNDIMAYFFGFFFGKTPLIDLSPKKTWEGFIGASVATVLSAFLLAGFLAKFQWLTCPRKDLTTGWLVCEPGAMFEVKEYRISPMLTALCPWLPWRTIRYLPVQKHALAFGLFASSIAPFGGFFASGFKRAFDIKDFGDSIPGHGGITDRMDCQMVMAVFAYIYYQSFIARGHATVGSLLAKALTLPPDQQLELYRKLENILFGEGYNFTASIHELGTCIVG